MSVGHQNKTGKLNPLFCHETGGLSGETLLSYVPLGVCVISAVLPLMIKVLDPFCFAVAEPFCAAGDGADFCWGLGACVFSSGRLSLNRFFLHLFFFFGGTPSFLPLK